MKHFNWWNWIYTSGYPRLCRLVPAGSTGGLYLIRPLLRRLSLATCPSGSTGGLYPAHPLLRRPFPGPHTPLTLVVHRSLVASPASPSPTPHVEPDQAGLHGNTKLGVAHFGTLFLSATSIGRNPKPPSQTDPRHRQTDNATHFRTSFLTVSFVGLSSGGLQNRPRRDC
jgi:hypothetical protein